MSTNKKSRKFSGLLGQRCNNQNRNKFNRLKIVKLSQWGPSISLTSLILSLTIISALAASSQPNLTSQSGLDQARSSNSIQSNSNAVQPLSSTNSNNHPISMHVNHFNFNQTESLSNLVKSHLSQASNVALQLNVTSSNSIQQQRAHLSPFNNKAVNSTLHRLGQQREHKTNYACEGTRMELACQEGKSIHLLRANYGRFSLSICNEHGHSNYSVSCTAFHAFLIMGSRCNSQSNCSVIVSKDIFGEPCEGTTKYLEVQYECNENDKDKGANNSGSGQLASSASAGRLDAQGSLASSSGVLASVHKSPAPPLLAPPPPQAAGAVGEASDEPVVLCAPQSSSRGLLWNSTRAGSLAIQSCPEGSSGRVSWLCELTANGARYSPSSAPDFSQCRSNWLQRLSGQIERLLELASRQSSGQLHRQLGELRLLLGELQLMTKTRELFSDDLKQIDVIFRQIIEQFQSIVNYSRQTNLATFNEDLFIRLVSILSSLFEPGQRNAWLDLTKIDTRRQLEVRLLNHLRDLGALLTSQSLPGSDLLSGSPARQPNLLVGFIDLAESPLPAAAAAAATASSKLKLIGDFQDQLSVRLAGAGQNDDATTSDEQTSGQLGAELKLSPSFVHELTLNGVSRLLVVDAEMAASVESSADSSEASSLETVNPSERRRRIFGVFGVASNSQLEPSKLAELLSQWPISVHFRLLAASPARQCNSLGNDGACTGHKAADGKLVCRCQRFGFVEAAGQPEPSAGEPRWLWRPMSPPSLGAPSADDLPAPAATTPSSGRSAGWSKALGSLACLLVLLVGVVVLLVHVARRASVRSQLSAKQASFLSAGSSILAAHAHDLTVPEAVLGGAPPCASSAAHCPAPAYKQQLYAAHLSSPAELAAAMDAGPSRMRNLRRLLRLRWPSFLTGGGSRASAVQHRRVLQASLSSPLGSTDYKNQYHTSGYGAHLHQAPARLAANSSSSSSYVSSSAYYEEIGPGNPTKLSTSQLAQGTNYRSQQQAHFGDHLKQRPASDQQQQQQLLSSHLHHHSLHQHQHQAHLIQWPQARLNSYQPSEQIPAPPPPPPPAGSQSGAAFGPAPISQGASNKLGAFNTSQLLNQTDLNGHSMALSSSSSGSQHSASASLTGNTMTPRHYLFASPNAVNAYKNSISQQHHYMQNNH